MKKFCVIIPAFNEAATIAGVIKNIQKHYPTCALIVVDDGSTDNTAQIAGDLGVLVVRHTTNRGIGAAVQTGLRTAIAQRYSTVVQCDADGQHDPAEMNTLLQAAADSVALVIGNRFGNPKTYASPLSRRWGSRLCTAVLYCCFGRPAISDPTSGFRLYTGPALPLFAANYPRHLPEPESIALVLKHGHRIREVPVVMHQRQGGISSITNRKALFLLFAIPFGILWIAYTGTLFAWPHERRTQA